MGNKSNEDAYKRCQSLRKTKDKSCQKALVTLYENVNINNMHGKSSGLENIFCSNSQFAVRGFNYVITVFAIKISCT